MINNKKLEFRKIANDINEDLVRTNIKDVKENNWYIVDVLVNNINIEKKDLLYIKLDISDNTGNMIAISLQENKYYEELVKYIEENDNYLIYGIVTKNKDYIGKNFDVAADKKILVIKAMKKKEK